MEEGEGLVKKSEIEYVLNLKEEHKLQEIRMKIRIDRKRGNCMPGPAEMSAPIEINLSLCMKTLIWK